MSDDGHNILEMWEAIPRGPFAPPTLWEFQFGQIGTIYVYVWGGGVEGGLEEAAGWLAENAPGHLSEPDYKEAAEEFGLEWPPTSDNLYKNSLVYYYLAIAAAAIEHGSPLVPHGVPSGPTQERFPYRGPDRPPVVPLREMSRMDLARHLTDDDIDSAAVALDWLVEHGGLDPDEFIASDEDLWLLVSEQAETDMTYTESGWIVSWEWHVGELHPGMGSYNEIWEETMDALAAAGDLDDDDLEQVNTFAAEHGIDAAWEPD